MVSSFAAIGPNWEIFKLLNKNWSRDLPFFLKSFMGVQIMCKEPWATRSPVLCSFGWEGRGVGGTGEGMIDRGAIDLLVIDFSFPSRLPSSPLHSLHLDGIMTKNNSQC